MNKRIKNKNKIIQLYLDGYNGNEIAEKEEANPKTIQRIIRDFKNTLNTKELNNFEVIHKRNRYNIVEARKNEKRNNNKIMSKQALIRWNRQSYISIGAKGEKQSLIFDISRGAKPNDMPEIFEGVL